MKKKILVVDDEPQILDSITDYFLEYDVITASNGHDGMRILRNTKPDLIVTDIIMPDMEGIEFIQIVNELDATIPIIAMSGNPVGRQYLEHAVLLGAVEKLEKPFELEELEQLIEKLIMQ
ncbi:MAG: response regulator [Desulfobulbaceae bacterium]|uniref:Response regulator n=1 Tax=Candidatus Desulfatifera sulfidica TaxID=2841691 RepID=A0A8J6T9H3_9BACT|nr:response regulator [Candidatus Desulfatifera sulfidica]